MTRLSGPVGGGAHGWAFGASLRDLAEVGYVESELFLEGEATRYALEEGSDYSFDGGWSALNRGTSPFRTRLIVRRPAGASEDRVDAACRRLLDKLHSWSPGIHEEKGPW